MAEAWMDADEAVVLLTARVQRCYSASKKTSDLPATCLGGFLARLRIARAGIVCIRLGFQGLFRERKRLGRLGGTGGLYFMEVRGGLEEGLEGGMTHGDDGL